MDIWHVNDGRREAGSIVTQANAARTAAHRTFNDTNKTRHGTYHVLRLSLRGWQAYSICVIDLSRSRLRSSPLF